MRSDYTRKESRWTPFRGVASWYVTPRSNRYFLGKRALRAACTPIPHFVNALENKRQLRREERLFAKMLTPTIRAFRQFYEDYGTPSMIAESEAAGKPFFTEPGISEKLAASQGYQRAHVKLDNPPAPGQPVPIVLGHDKHLNTGLFAPGDIIQFENMKDGQKVRCVVEQCSGGSCIVRRLGPVEDHVGESREQGPGEGT